MTQFSNSTHDEDKPEDIKVGKGFALHTLKFPYRRFLDKVAVRLQGIHPDVISFTAFVVALVTGYVYWRLSVHPIFLIVCIFLIILRMTLNTLDGLIALKIGRTSMIGEMVNALPDRYADMFLVAGIALSPLCNTLLGMVAAINVLLVSYTGMLGKAIGVSWQHHGPLDKVDRLFLIIAATAAQYVIMRMNGSFIMVWGHTFTAFDLCMIIFIILGQITVILRVRGMVEEIHANEGSQ
jgi:phosphatidylglycerophosphate synthase